MTTEGRTLAKEEWLAAAPKDAEDVARYYRESTYLAKDLADWHATPQRQYLTQALVAFAKEHGVKSVLDVGCGRGDDLLALKAAGITRLWGVEPNDAQRALVWEAGGISVSDTTLPGGFDPDLTVMIDVLEHLPNPQEFLGQVLARIPIGGYLAECTGTWDCETPLHLPQHQGWRPMGQILKAGFQAIARADRLIFYQRMGEEAYPSQSILLCAWRGVTTGTLEALWAMARRGFGKSEYDPTEPVYDLLVRPGDADIGRARGIIVSDWWRDRPDDVFLMVDDDVVFTPDAADRLIALAREKRSIACGAYATKGGAHFACQLFPNQEIEFGPRAVPVPIKYAATGFMAVHRDVIDALIPTLQIVHPDEQFAYWPMFQQFSYQYQPPRWEGDPGKWEGLSEDFAFSARARNLGFEVWLDPAINLVHEGFKGWTFEDVVNRVKEGDTKFLYVVEQPKDTLLTELEASA